MADVRNPPADIDRSDSIEKPTAYDEKGDIVNSVAYDGEGTEGTDMGTVMEVKGDPFPIDPSVPVEEFQLTVRAIVVGCILGSIVGASNIYLGLKTGYVFLSLSRSSSFGSRS